MKNKIWIKALNIILALAMLFGNAPATWALRQKDSLEGGKASSIRDDLRNNPRRGAAGGVLTLEEHLAVNFDIDQVIAEIEHGGENIDTTTNEFGFYKYRNIELEKELGIRRVYILPISVPHYGIRNDALYIPNTLSLREERQVARHEASELRRLIYQAIHLYSDYRELLRLTEEEELEAVSSALKRRGVPYSPTDELGELVLWYKDIKDKIEQKKLIEFNDRLVKDLEDPNNPYRDTLDNILSESHDRAPKIDPRITKRFDSELEKLVKKHNKAIQLALNNYKLQGIKRDPTMYVRGAADAGKKEIVEQAIYNYREALTKVGFAETAALSTISNQDEYAQLLRLVNGLTPQNFSESSLADILLASLDFIKANINEGYFVFLGEIVFEETIILANKFGGLNSDDISGLQAEINQWVPSDKVKKELHQALGIRPAREVAKGTENTDYSVADASMYGFTGGGRELEDFLKDARDKVKEGALVIGARAVLENAGTVSMLKAIKEIMPEFKVIVWVTDDFEKTEINELKARGLENIEFIEVPTDDGVNHAVLILGLLTEAKYELSRSQVTVVNSVNDIEKFILAKQLQTDAEKEKMRKYIEGQFSLRGYVITLDAPAISKNQASINPMPIIFSNAIARLSPEELKKRYKEFLTRNLKDEDFPESEATRRALANLEDTILEVPLATARNARIIEAQKRYAEGV